MADEVVVDGGKDGTDGAATAETEALESSIASVMGPGAVKAGDVEADAGAGAAAAADGDGKSNADVDTDELPKGLTDEAKARIQKRFDKYSGDAKTAKEEKAAETARAIAAEERATKAEAALTAQAASRIKDADVPADYLTADEQQAVAEYQEIGGVLRWAEANAETGAEVTDPKTGNVTTYTADQIKAQLAVIRQRYTDAAIDARPALKRAKNELAADLVAARAQRTQRAKAGTPQPAATTAKTKVTNPPPSIPAGASGAVRTSGKTVAAPTKVETEDDMEKYIGAHMKG